MEAKRIYAMLRQGGLTRAGALGMLGNLMAESTLKENIAQRGMTKLSDEQYTAAADNGLIDFVRDAVGYGLAQFTYHTRKANLLSRARNDGVSVGDGEMQVRFILWELANDFPNVRKVLTTSNDIDACADIVCTQYERPAVNNLAVRRGYAHQFDNEIPEVTEVAASKDPVKATFPPDPTILAFQLWMNYNGYAVEANGYKSKEFFTKLREFVDDMEKC